MQGEMAPMTSLEDRELVLESRTLKARLYVPVNEEAQALVVYFHGGDFVMGDLVTHEWLCRRLAFDTKMRFLAVDYRLAPEHPFPAGLNDALDAIRYVATHRSEFGDESAQLIVMGDSAGANLATVAATLLRDENLGIVAQVLIYPTLGPELVTDSAHRYGSGYLLDVESLRYDYGQYLGEFGDHTDPRVTPLLSTDLFRERRRRSWSSPSVIPCATKEWPTRVCLDTLASRWNSSKRRVWCTVFWRWAASFPKRWLLSTT